MISEEVLLNCGLDYSKSLYIRYAISLKEYPRFVKLHGQFMSGPSDGTVI